MFKMTGKYRCHYKACGLSRLTAEDSRVEVCTMLPGHKQNDKLQVQWAKKGEHGEAMFHSPCWMVLLKSARARNKKNITVKLCATEKAMIKEAAKTAEQHDGTHQLEAEAARIIHVINRARNCVVFTGAGISTSAGIGDFRGKSGKWTEDDRKKVATEVNEDGDEMASSSAAVAGIPSDKLSELHGNVFIEHCERCHQRYERDFEVCDNEGSIYFEEILESGHSSVKRPRHAIQCKLCKLTHRTGRTCQQPGCTGHLQDTIINFSDLLDETVLDRATQAASQSDLMLSLGSTMVVTPACDLVVMGQKPLRLIVCNRQKTGMDEYCYERDTGSGEQLGARVFGDCDDLMRRVMTGLLGEQECKQWEAERTQRMIQYDTKRLPV